MAATKIFVYENGKELHVYPGVVVLGYQAHQARQIVIVNSASEDIDVHVPDGLIPNSQGGQVQPVTERIPKNGKGGTHTNGKTDMAVAYSVTGVKTGRKGIGGSDPVIIIDT